MSDTHLTIIYRVKAGELDEARKRLDAADWTASSWSHAIRDRDAARHERDLDRAELAHRDAVIAGLLEALQMALKYVRGEGSEAEIEQCLDAIAKAEGQKGGAL